MSFASHGEPRALATGVQARGELRTLTARLLILLIALSGQSDAEAVTSFDDIEYWVGNGANQAALVLDWQGDTTTDNALAWGYRWDGTAKGVDMLTAIIVADERLYAKLGSISGFGVAVVGLGYDANDDGQFALDDDTSFDEQGFASSGPADGATSLDPADRYAEGWFVSGFWQYGVATGNPYDGGTWVRSGAGISSRDMLNQSWHSLAFTHTYSNQAFAQNPLAAEISSNADFNGDGDIDGRDFLAWQRGESPDPLSAGDLALWSEQYGMYPNELLAFSGGALQSAALLIPEPTSLACLCLAAGAWSAFFSLSRPTTRRLNS